MFIFSFSLKLVTPAFSALNFAFTYGKYHICDIYICFGCRQSESTSFSLLQKDFKSIAYGTSTLYSELVQLQPNFGSMLIQHKTSKCKGWSLNMIVFGLRLDQTHIFRIISQPKKYLSSQIDKSFFVFQYRRIKCVYFRSKLKK